MKNFMWAIIGIIVIVLVVVFSNSNKDTRPVMDLGAKSSTETVTTNPNEAMPSTKNTSQNTVVSLKTSTIKEGTGTAAVVGDTVTVNYTGMFLDGTAFDSNIDPKFQHVSPFSFNLGAGMVIKGWDEGVLGMKVGEKRHLLIPAALGYGANGMPPVIPPNANLQFDVEVTGIHHN